MKGACCGAVHRLAVESALAESPRGWIQAISTFLAPAALTKLHTELTYGDEKVANRESRVWHGATEKGP